jgi:hypothetical protein
MLLMKRPLIAVTTFMFTAGCWSPSEGVDGHLSSQSTLEGVRVSYVASQDLGHPKMAFVLRISNQSGRNLENCVISLDETHHASLAEMIYTPRIRAR